MQAKSLGQLYKRRLALTLDTIFLKNPFISCAYYNRTYRI